MKVTVALSIGVVMVGLVALTGCTAGAASPTAATSAAAGRSAAGPSAASGTVMLHISGFAYQLPASVAPGARIMVMNADSSNHTVTSDTGNRFNVIVPAGGSAVFTAPTTPGSYPFHCTYHSNMHGVLVVKAP